MDDLAKRIVSNIKACTKEYGEEFKETLIFISVTRERYGNKQWLVEYNLGSSYDGNQTKGADLSATITEFMRRKGWTEANKPMVLIEDRRDDDLLISEDEDKVPS